MQCLEDRVGRKPPGRAAPGRHAALAVLMLAFAAGGCSTDGQVAARPQPGTIAFESIDGPPQAAFQKLVQKLDQAAHARNLAVVSREAPAQYRVRGYLAANVEHSRTTIAWVLDVYDADQHRALRISGQEPGGQGSRDWSAADDKVLQRIADTGMEQLAGLAGSPTPAPAAPPPASPGGEGRLQNVAALAGDRL